MNFSRSEALFQKAQERLVGGVNSPVRAFKSVGGSPIFINRGEGAYIYDADDNRYIDYVGSFGPLILGHVPGAVHTAVKEALDKGTSFGASTEAEIQLADLVHQAFPSIDMVRFVSSGTEAVMSAIRLARAYTQRTKIIKFAGCYHGHSDHLLAQAGSGLLTLSMPGSAGVPQASVQDTLIAPYNDMEAVEKIFEENKGKIAAVLIEPVPGNMGVVLPQNNFLEKLREITTTEGSMLVFDEVMSGFRQNFGGAQAYFNIRPDITCLGKVIGGGFPVGAYGGRRDIMEMVAPLGPMYQAGTLSGNPIAMTAGIHTLMALQAEGFYEKLNHYTAGMARGISELAIKYQVDLQVEVFGSMITPFFTKDQVTDFASAIKSDTHKFSKVFWSLVKNGVYPPPSQFESWFVSARHGSTELENTLKSFEMALKEL